MKEDCPRGGREESAFILVQCNRILKGIQTNSESYTLIKVLINSSLRALQVHKDLGLI